MHGTCTISVNKNVYGRATITQVIARVHPVHLMNSGQRQMAADCQTRPTDLGCESACRLLYSLHRPSPFIITQPESWPNGPTGDGCCVKSVTEGVGRGPVSWLTSLIGDDEALHGDAFVHKLQYTSHSHSFALHCSCLNINQQFMLEIALSSITEYSNNYYVDKHRTV